LPLLLKKNPKHPQAPFDPPKKNPTLPKIIIIIIIIAHVMRNFVERNFVEGGEGGIIFSSNKAIIIRIIIIIIIIAIRRRRRRRKGYYPFPINFLVPFKSPGESTSTVRLPFDSNLPAILPKRKRHKTERRASR